jgi:uncharacterized membrane protein HdeD (DUF308 family)
MTANASAVQAKQSPWWLVLLSGIFTVIIGALLLSAPVKTGFALVMALGLYWVISGIVTLIGMFMESSNWGWKLLIGAISLIAGVMILRYPIVSALTVPDVIVLLLGIQGLVTGVIGIVMAFKGGGWGIGILSALSVIFGLFLIANWNAPGMGATLAWAAGFFALISGTFQIVRAFQSR